MDCERSREFRIGKVDRCDVLQGYLERLEQRPVLNLVAVLRVVVNAVELATEHQARSALSERSGNGPLQCGSVEVGEIQLQTIGRELPTQNSDPLAAVEVGVLSLVLRRTEHSGRCPGTWHAAKGNEIVLPVDLGELSIQGQIDPEPRQGFQKASVPL